MVRPVGHVRTVSGPIVEYVRVSNHGLIMVGSRTRARALTHVASVLSSWSVSGRRGASGHVSIRLAKRHIFSYEQFGRVFL